MNLRGAEAVIRKSKLLGKFVVIKERLAKTYRVKILDTKLRIGRTRAEARLLHKAKLAGVDCPIVFEVTDFTLTLSYLSGKRPKLAIEHEAKLAGELLAKLHGAHIIHGDYTPANLIIYKGSLFVIDFGLGFISKNIEDKATDVFTMIRSISKSSKVAFLRGYSVYHENPAVLKRLEKIEQRIRYA